MTRQAVPKAVLEAEILANPLFKDKKWRVAPYPIEWDEQECDELTDIGRLCVKFLKAIDWMYYRLVEGKSILRKRVYTPLWVIDYWERGKPQSIIERQRKKAFKGELPELLRPDLVITANGYKMTEIEVVPGGLGLTGNMYRVYEQHGYRGGLDRLIGGFEKILKSEGKKAGVVVSAESETYRPEWEWVCEKLGVPCLRPEDVDDHDRLYRFFELFDLDNIANVEKMEAMEVTPGWKSFHEEKLNAALLHHYLLEEYWEESLGKRDFNKLKTYIPESWVVERAEAGAHASLWGPSVGGRPMQNWLEMGDASKRDRDYVLKRSGFHEESWGARSVTVGSDCSGDAWKAAISEAVESADDNLFVLQRFEKPVGVNNWTFDDAGEILEQKEKVRLCPYFRRDGDDVELIGGLYTGCEMDKKVLHGMESAVLLPCFVKNP